MSYRSYYICGSPLIHSSSCNFQDSPTLPCLPAQTCGSKPSHTVCLVLLSFTDNLKGPFLLKFYIVVRITTTTRCNTCPHPLSRTPPEKINKMPDQRANARGQTRDGNGDFLPILVPVPANAQLFLLFPSPSVPRGESVPTRSIIFTDKFKLIVTN